MILRDEGEGSKTKSELVDAIRSNLKKKKKIETQNETSEHKNAKN